MAPKITYQGLSLSAQYLTVHFQIEIAGSIRFSGVKIPIDSLRAEAFHDALDLMNSRWNAQLRADNPGTEPLF